MNTAVETLRFVRSERMEALPPPKLARGPVAWVRENLFSGPVNTVLTLAVVYLLYVVIPPVVRFLFTDAVWSGMDRRPAARIRPGTRSGRAGRSFSIRSTTSCTAPIRRPNAGA